MVTTRRQFIKGLALSGAAAGIGLTGCDDSGDRSDPAGEAAAAGAGRGSSGSPPNVLLVVNDEERHWAMTEACLPSDRLAAFQALLPARMRLRERGVRFSNYYATTAPCSPARSVLYTGHHAPDTQVVDNLNFDTQQSLRAETPTIADVLGAAGYYCAYKGKVHLAHDLDSAAKMRSMYGFRDYEGPFATNDVEGPKSGYTRDPEIAADAADWILNTATSLSKPWLLAVNFVNPHDVMLVDIDGRAGEVQQQQSDEWPIVPVPRDDRYFYWWNPQKPANCPGVDGYTPETQGPRPQALDEWASLLSAMFGNVPLEDDYLCDVEVYEGETRPTTRKKTMQVPLWQAYLNYYLNCLIDNDSAIQTVLAALTEATLQHSTVVVFTADHGELAMSHGGYSRYFDEAMTEEQAPDLTTTTLMPLRQKGPLAYQENNNVPFVVASLSDDTTAPARKAVPAIGVDVPALAASIDLLPTLVAWAGKTASWYSQQFGRATAELGMRDSLPGVSLAAVVKRPAQFTSPQWSAAGSGRTAVLLTSDSPTTVDADFAYAYAKGQAETATSAMEKRGMLRAFFDGTNKYVRYFSPLDYATANSAESSALDYPSLTSLSNGQDLQLFDHGADSLERSNVVEAADVAALNRALYDLMAAELADPTRTPDTVATMLCQAGYAGYEEACESAA